VGDRTWHVAEATTQHSAREAIEFAMMQAGALGTETTETEDLTRVRAYFEKQPELESLRSQLAEGLRIYNHAPSALIDVRLEQLADRDWLAEWKKSWRPIQVGRFIVAPPWLSEPPAVAADPNTILIQIEPGMAFGTGTHETTRLCLQAIDKYFRGQSFLDVGTGTGVLAIAAARMCQKHERQGEPPSVTACDVDADAIEIARENSRLNDVYQQIDFRVGSVDDQTPSADFVCANLTAPVILELLPALLGVTCGRLVLSGILDSQVELVIARLSELATDPIAINQDGEWVALVI
jgi:ribosomal protein L11 methyltransferase